MGDELIEPTESMTEVMSLGGDVDALARYYARWAESYDEDVTSHGYALPDMMLETLSRTAEMVPEAGLSKGDTEILDAGCGTGLVGVALAEAGYRLIDGIDLSPEMIDVARSRGVYRHLESGVDLTRPPPERLVGSADVVMVAGVFTVGHIPPAALTTVTGLCRSGGFLIVSTRRAYYDSTEYRSVSDELVAEGQLALVLRIDDGPYTMDSTAHYWSYQVAADGGD